MPLQVIQGHRFWYQSKAHATSYYLYPISYYFKVTADFWSNLRFRQGDGGTHLNSLVSDEPQNTGPRKFGLKKLVTLLYRGLSIS